jgi:hypothetical protein
VQSGTLTRRAGWVEGVQDKGLHKYTSQDVEDHGEAGFSRKRTPPRPPHVPRDARNNVFVCSINLSISLASAKSLSATFLPASWAVSLRIRFDISALRLCDAHAIPQSLLDVSETLPRLYLSLESYYMIYFSLLMYSMRLLHDILFSRV